MPEDLFIDAKPAPPIERRDWRDSPDETHRLAALKSLVVGRRRVPTRDAADYGELLARQVARRDLLALRRRVEGWAADRADEFAGVDFDPDEDAGIEMLRDLVVVLDDLLADRGAVERIEIAPEVSA